MNKVKISNNTQIHLFWFSFLLATLFSSVSIKAQEVEVIDFPELQEKMIETDASLTIFNFWATWCGPCVKEIPHFETYTEDSDVEIYLVSLDFIENKQRVQQFVEINELKSKVYLLNETDYDSFMEKVSPQWTGAIPATLFVDRWGKSHFHESEFSKEELDEVINEYLN